jgi:hypothetical protein
LGQARLFTMSIPQAQASFTHGYHGISLIRHYPGIGLDPVKITTM